MQGFLLTTSMRIDFVVVFVRVQVCDLVIEASHSRVLHKHPCVSNGGYILFKDYDSMIAKS